MRLRRARDAAGGVPPSHPCALPRGALPADLGIEEADALHWVIRELSANTLFAGGSALRRLTDASSDAMTPKGTHRNVCRTRSR